MNSRAFNCYYDTKRTFWEDLNEEFNSINRDVSVIKEMEVSDEAKKPILAELQKQINKVKEKMHNYIDSL